MARRRFNQDEKDLIADGPGTAIEWRNGGHWHPGELTGPISRDDISGFPYVPITNTSDRGGTPKGAYVRAYPGYIRRPSQN